MPRENSKTKMEKRIVFKFSLNKNLPFDKEILKAQLSRCVSEYFGKNVSMKNIVIESDTIYGGCPDLPFECNTSIFPYSQQ